MVPMAIIVAVPDPQIAPKRAHATIPYIAVPPLIHPKNVRARKTILLAICPLDIKFPTKMKNNTAK